MAPQTHIELDETGEPMVSTFDKLAHVILSVTLKVFFYVVPLTIGLHEYKVLMDSLFIRILSVILGFCFSVISWLTASLLPVFVFGVEYDFAKEVFNLYWTDSFRIAETFVFVLLPLSRYLTRTMNRTITSYQNRKYIFIVTGFVVIACIASIIEYVSSLYNPYVCLFNFAVTGIIFLILMRSKKDIRKTRIRPRTYFAYGN